MERSKARPQLASIKAPAFKSIQFFQMLDGRWSVNFSIDNETYIDLMDKRAVINIITHKDPANAP